MKEQGKKSSAQKSDHKRYLLRHGEKTSTGMGVLILVIAAAICLLGWTAYRGVQIARLSRKIDVHVDGTTSLKKQPVSGKLLAKYGKSAPSDLITSKQATKTVKVSLVFAGINEDEEIDEHILRLLKQYRIKATFAVPAAHARENDVLLREIAKNGQRVIGNGITGKENLGAMPLKKALSTLQLAKQTLESESERKISKNYLMGTSWDSSLLQAAKATGFDQVVVPDESDLIDSKTFTSQQEAQNYVKHLDGHRIVVVKLDGLADKTHQEPAIVAATPALDKQADLRDQAARKRKKEVEIDQVTKWLLAALAKQKIANVKLDDLGVEKSASYIKAMLADPSQEAVIYRYSLTNKKQLALLVKGVDTTSEYEAVKHELTAHQASASFVVNGTTPSQLVKRMTADGYGIETGGLADKASLTIAGAYQNIEKGKEALTKNGYQPIAYVMHQGDNETAVKRSCWQVSLIPVQAQNPAKLSRGAYYLYQADQTKEIGELLAKADKGKYKVVKFSTILKDSGTIPQLSRSKIAQLKKQNQGRQADFLKYVPTTEQAVAFTFGNLSNQAVDLDVAQRLNKRGYQGTFFASFDELRTAGPAISQLRQQGHEIGLVYAPNNQYKADFTGTCEYLHDSLAYCKWRYDDQPKLVYLTGKNAKKAVLQAIHAYGMQAVGTTRSMIASKTAATDQSSLGKAARKVAKVRFSRGSLDYFNLGYYRHDQGSRAGQKTIMGDMVMAMIREHLDSIAYKAHGSKVTAPKSRYQIKTVSHLLASPLVYRLNPPKQDKVTMNKDFLANLKTPAERFGYLKRHYVGSNFVVSRKKLPGFNDSEIAQLNKIGRLTDKKVLFLTFDDWGSDNSINKILYVLKKHHVKATFFILTQNVQYNPNLLRAIALDGHEIASHSNSHDQLAVANKKHTAYRNLTKAERLKLRKDLVKSYEKLNKYVGDVKVAGKPALQPDFRPPTLEVSKAGLFEAFDVGFRYVISGNVSTDDYARKDYDKYVKEMRYGSPKSAGDFNVASGSVIVMHSLENAYLTPQMLDKMIPIWKKEGYKFARVDEYTSDFSGRVMGGR